MTKFLLAAGVAALALTTPAIAGPGGHGGGPGGSKGGGGQQNQKSDHGGGGKHGGDLARADQGGGMKQGTKADHVRFAPRHEYAHARVAARHDVEHADRRMNEKIRTRDVADDGDHHGFEPRFGLNGRSAGLINGCPPGLAAKHNHCLPPGQAKKLVGATLPGAYTRSMLSGAYRDWYRDDQRYLYRMGDDYIYRVDRSNNLVNALIPYVNRDFSYYPVGQMYPSDFNYYNVPQQYQSYYPDGGQYDYRYGSNAIYSLDPKTQAVQSIVALLAGDLGVGQRLPSNYGVYNVPLQYRDQYADSATDLYRYNDGYIYRADPTTQLVTAVINALV